MAKVALITGVTGQDGSYLAESLLNKGYEVHGMVRRTSSFCARATRPAPRVCNFTTATWATGPGLEGLSSRCVPTRSTTWRRSRTCASRSINLNTPPTWSDSARYDCWKRSAITTSVAVAPRGFIRLVRRRCSARSRKSQRETTPFHPRSPYACAKLYAHWQTVNYREAYGLFACNGILFNHESPRRGENFVTRKITRSATRIKLGIQEKLALGNLEAQRDWGFAGDYVEAMWLMLQQENPDDYVIATGETHSVQEFLEVVFDRLKLKIKDHVEIDPRFFRPAEVDLLIGDASKAKRQLGWEPRVKFERLAELMVEADLELAEQELRAKAQ